MRARSCVAWIRPCRRSGPSLKTGCGRSMTRLARAGRGAQQKHTALVREIAEQTTAWQQPPSETNLGLDTMRQLVALQRWQGRTLADIMRAYQATPDTTNPTLIRLIETDLDAFKLRPDREPTRPRSWTCGARSQNGARRAFPKAIGARSAGGGDPRGGRRVDALRPSPAGPRRGDGAHVHARGGEVMRARGLRPHVTSWHSGTTHWHGAVVWALAPPNATVRSGSDRVPKTSPCRSRSAGRRQCRRALLLPDGSRRGAV